MKKMTKKVWFFALVGIITYLSSGIAAAQSGQCGDNMYWSFNSETGTMTITGYGEMYDYWPNDIFIGWDAPWKPYQQQITSVDIRYVANGGGIKSIGRYAFWRCINLTSVSIPNSVRKIRQGAFDFCESLTSLDIPNSVVEIEDFAFRYAPLSSIIFPNGITIIGGNTAGFSSSAENRDISITIPSKVTFIGNNAFVRSNPIEMNVKALFPPELGTNVFGQGYWGTGPLITDCILRVPSTSVSLYQNAAIWQDFNVVGGGWLVAPQSNNYEQGFVLGDDLYGGNRTTATVEAIAHVGYHFVNWTIDGEVISTSNPYTFTVNGDIELVANFEEGESRIINRTEQEVTIFQNSPGRELKIESGTLQIEKVDIIDITGKIVLTSKETTINISHLHSGIYFVKLTTERGEIVRKFLKN